jgi:hypothetical protein
MTSNSVEPWRMEYLDICHRTAATMAEQRGPYNLWMHRGGEGRSGWAICLPMTNTPAGFDTDRTSGMGKTWHPVKPPAPFTGWESVPLSDLPFALFWAMRNLPILGTWTPDNPSPYDISK